MNYSENAINLFKKLYFKKDPKDPNILLEEHPNEVFTRVSNYVANGDTQLQMKFDTIMKEGYFRPCSPCMMNVGIQENPQTAACFVSGMKDNLISILDMDKEAALIFASGSGIGANFGSLREKKAILSSGGCSSGPFSFIKKLAATGEAVKSGGRSRRAAILIMFFDNHPDLLEFITLKNGVDQKTLRSMNLSIAISNAFMKAVENDSDWDLIGVVDKEIKSTHKARDIFNKIAENAHKTGDPGVWFIDKANEDNGLIEQYGRIISTNPCFEEHSLIATSKGAFPIKDLVGRETTIYDGTKWETINNFRQTGANEKLLQITLSDATHINITPYHTMYLDNGIKIKASELQIGQKLAFNDTITYNGDKIELSAYLKGFLLADGHTTKQTKIHSPQLWVYEPKYCCIQKLIDSALESPIESKNTISDVYAKDTKGRAAKELKGLVYRGKEELAKWCSQYKNTLPKYVFEWDYKTKCEFLAGLFDGDGTACDSSKGFGYQLCSIHKDFLVDVLTILKSIGVYGRVALSKAACKKEMPGGVYECKDCWRLSIGQSYSIILAKQVKFSRLKSFADRKSRYKVNFKYNKIEKIKELPGVHNVYCCTVPNTHKILTASGIITGQCGEIIGLPWSACALASINLTKFVQDLTFDFNKFKEIVKLGIYFLDGMLDISGYPTEKYKKMALNTRPLGLGIMGMADMLCLMDIPYDSQKAFDLCGDIIKSLNMNSICASKELAEKHGSFLDFEQNRKNMTKLCKKFGVKLEENEGLRNSGWTSIAPTGSISISADCSPGMEPLFGICYVKNISDSDEKWIFVNPIFEKKYKDKSWYKEAIEKIAANHGSCQRINCVPKEIQKVWKVAHDIHWKDRIEMQAHLQKNVSNAISSTINLPKSATVDEIKSIYITAWEKGLKGITVYRNGSLDEQPIEFEQKKDEKVLLSLRERSKIMAGLTYAVETGHGKIYVTVNKNEDGKVLEIFTNGGKNGGVSAANLEALARLASLALQKGVSIDAISHTLLGINDGTCVWDKLDTADKKATQITSIPDAIGQILYRFYVKKDTVSSIEEISEGIELRCSDCGGPAVMKEGCIYCPNCGSKCG